MNNTYIPDLIDSWIASIQVINVPGIRSDLNLTDSDAVFLASLELFLSMLKERYINDLHNSRS